jgi:hypothetical protein
LNGVNANGIEVVSIAVTIEIVGQDSPVRSYATTNHFDFAGVDCVLDGDVRTMHRAGFSYYTGFPASATPSQLGSGRRRNFTVLNGVQDSPSHAPWELLYSSQSFGSRNADEVLGLIDSVMPGGGGNPSGLTYAAWLTENGLPEDTPVAGDADGDGLTNGVEFYIGTSPITADLQPLTISRVDEDHVAVSYTMGKDREGVTAVLEGSSDFTTWAMVDVPDESWTITPGETLDSAMATVPISGMQFFRLNVTLE